MRTGDLNAMTRLRCAAPSAPSKLPPSLPRGAAQRGDAQRAQKPRRPSHPPSFPPRVRWSHGAPPGPSTPQNGKPSPFRPLYSKIRVKLARLATSRQALHAANVANSVVLMITLPAALHGGLRSGAAVQRILVSVWVSSFGAMMLLRESGLPLVQRWLRHHFQFLTTSSGHMAFMLCAATMGLTTGPFGILAGVATLANAWAQVNRKTKRRAPPPRPNLPSGAGGREEGTPLDDADQASARRFATEDAARGSGTMDGRAANPEQQKLVPAEPAAGRAAAPEHPVAAHKARLGATDSDTVFEDAAVFAKARAGALEAAVEQAAVEQTSAPEGSCAEEATLEPAAREEGADDAEVEQAQAVDLL